jgi:hypothetical protein
MPVDTKIYTETEMLEFKSETYSFSIYKLMIRITLDDIVVIIILTFTILLNRFLIANGNS